MIMLNGMGGIGGACMGGVGDDMNEFFFRRFGTLGWKDAGFIERK
jgi:hypothetical protein